MENKHNLIYNHSVCPVRPRGFETVKRYRFSDKFNCSLEDTQPLFVKKDIVRNRYLATDYRCCIKALRVFNGAQAVHVGSTTVDDLHSDYPELKDWGLASSQLKDYFNVVKTLLSQLVDKERGARKHRKIGNYVNIDDEWLNSNYKTKKKIR